VAAVLGSQASGNLADSPFFQLLTAALLALGILAGLIGMNAVLRRAIMAHSVPAPMTAAPREIINLEETTNGKLD
jgi:hypothetical protein